MSTHIQALLIVTLSSLLTAPASAKDAPSPCEHLVKNDEVYSCLNAYAKTVLAQGSPADQAFKNKLERLFRRYNLGARQVQTQSLSQNFQIIVDQKSQYRGSDQSQLCFEFDKTQWGAGRERLIKRLTQQIDEAALFLADIHASSWGQQVSLLFPIKEVSICSRSLSEGRALSFEQRSLRIGIQQNPMSSSELLQAWNSGNPIRSSELSWASILPFSGKVREFLNRDEPETLIRDKMADNWVILNPTGNLRTTAMYTLSEAIFALKSKISDRKTSRVSTNQIQTQMQETLKGPGFTEADRKHFEQLSKNPQDMMSLYSLWQQKTYSPQNMLLVLENAIGDRLRQDTKLHLTLRKINAGISVANDKNISLGLEQLIQSSLPVSQFEDQAEESKEIKVEFTRTKTVTDRHGTTTTETTNFNSTGVNPKNLSLNADEVNSWIAVNLIDDISIQVQLPQLSAETYQRISLYQALKDYLPAGSQPKP